MTSEIDPKNVIGATFDEIPEEARKAFQEHRRVAEERRKAAEAKELEEYLACFKKDRLGKVTQVKQAVLPPPDGAAKEAPTISASSVPVTPEDVSNMLYDNNKLLKSHMEYMIENGLTKAFKSLNISTEPSLSHDNRLASSSSAPYIPPGNPQFGMPLNFVPSQAPPAVNALPSKPETAMVVSPPMVDPLDSIPSSATTGRTNELASFIPPYRTVAYSTPPIPPRGTGVPHGPVPDSYFHRFSAPDRVQHVEPRRPPLNMVEECLAVFKEDLKKQIRETFGVEMPNRSRTYQKPYPSFFDSVPYPAGWRVPDFVKFSGEDSRTTWEHVSQYLAQLGEASSVDALKVRLFSLSLTGTAFSWFSSLSPSFISSWEDLECKFHDHFYSPNNELKLSDLTSVRQSRDESVSDFIRRFRDTKNRCFNLSIGEKDLAGLAFNGLHSYLREKQDDHSFITLAQLQQKASAQESRSKEVKEGFKPVRRNVHYVEYDSDSSSDESSDAYAAEFTWPSKAKSYSCDSLTPVHKNR